jgi:hypothetical protein
MKPLLGGATTVLQRLVRSRKISERPLVFSSNILGSAHVWRTRNFQTPGAGY